MKRNYHFIAGLIFISSLLFLSVQCTKKEDLKINEDPQVENGIPLPNIHAQFVPNSSSDGTKSVTTPEGKVSWDADDEIMAFIVPAGEMPEGTAWANYRHKYVTNEQDCQNGIFTPESADDELDATKNYSWYIMSPYSETVTDPIGDDQSQTAFTFNGQTLDIGNPLSNLTAFDIVTATSRSNAGQEPEFVMAHKCALMEFLLGNASTQDMTLDKIDFIAPEGVKIGGTYRFSFSQWDNLIPKEATNQLTATFTGNNKVLKAEDGVYIYVIMPPFQLENGSPFTVKVYTDKGIIETTTNPTSDISFDAGILNSAIIPLLYEENVSSVTLDREEIYISKDGTDQLTATIHPETAENKNVSWESSDPEIVKVDENGNLTALSVGDAIITVTREDGGDKAQCTVHVTGLKNKSVVLKQGESRELDIVADPAESVTWESSNNNVVTVDQSGNLTAVSVGTEEITVTTESLVMKCSVRVVPVPEGCDFIAITANGVDIPMIKVNHGTFIMGATPEQGNDAEPRERPAHEVTLTKDYYIGMFQTTQELWKAVTGDNPQNYHNKDDYSCPVDLVSWNDICGENGFLSKLNAAEKTGVPAGMTFALPTEAQWEYAARGGHKSRSKTHPGNSDCKYSGSDNIDDVAWYTNNAHGEIIHTGGLKQPNELGLYDMSGNLWEWCFDWYDEKYYTESSMIDPIGPNSGTLRVMRGGGYFAGPANCRVSKRDFLEPNSHGRWNDYGFRLVLVMESTN